MSGYGFVTSSGQQWVRPKGRAGIPEAFLPQYVMYKNPLGIHQEADRVSKDIQTFLVDHGFTGFHVPVYCRWFDLERDRASAINLEDPNPDLRTFAVLENFISQVHAAGGVVHLWAWGDEARTQTPHKWGLNGPADQRLQRYIAARLGPIPGWTMGYGFDLDEWVTDEQIKTWRGLWQSTMTGGVANIWGKLDGDLSINMGFGASLPYDNPHWIKAWSRFFQNRFEIGTLPVDDPTPWDPWSTIEYFEEERPFGYDRRDSDLPWENNVFFAAFPTKWLDGERFVLNFTGAGLGQDNDSFNTVEGRFIMRE